MRKSKKSLFISPQHNTGYTGRSISMPIHCVHTGHLPVLQGSCGVGKETSTIMPVNILKAGWSQRTATCTAQQQAETCTTFICFLMLKGIKRICAQSQTCPINPVPKMPHKCYKSTLRSHAFLQDRRDHCKEGNRSRTQSVTIGEPYILSL